MNRGPGIHLLLLAVAIRDLRQRKCPILRGTDG